MQPRYNIAIIGKTGVGKSSLINYLFGKPLRQEGTGRPVTEHGFHPVEFRIKNLPVRVYDSWGLEIDNYTQWRQALDQELVKREYTQEIDQWFHAVFYCCSVGDSRIQDFELGIIRDLIAKYFHVTVIFTKADLATREEIETLKTLVEEEFGSQVSTIAVCSKGGRYNDRVVKTFGLKELTDQAAKSFWLTMAQRLPKRCLLTINTVIDQWADEQRAFIKQNVGFLGSHSPYFLVSLENRVQNLITNLEAQGIKDIVGTELDAANTLYRTIAQALNLRQLEPVIQDLDLSPARDKILTSLCLAAKIRNLLLNLLVPGRLLFQKKIITENVIFQLNKVVSTLKIQIQPLELELEKNIRDAVARELQKPWVQQYFEHLGSKLKSKQK